jgi:hypothetical protein
MLAFHEIGQPEPIVTRWNPLLWQIHTVFPGAG